MRRSIALTVVAILACAVAAGAEVTVVSTFPETGAQGVDPNTTQIRIRFSEGVDTGGYSLVTSDKGLPVQTEGKPAFVEDGTLCIWNVKLYPGLTYAMNINSERFTGFRSARDTNVAVTPYLLTFSTAGTKPTGKAAEVKVASTFPATGSENVDPLTPTIRVRFSGPMLSNGWSFLTSELGKGIPAIGNPLFSESNTVCELPVKLEPETKYAVSISGDKESDFRSARNPDVAATPFVLTFTTGKGEPAEVVYRGSARGSCGAKGSALRFELIGPGNIHLYYLKNSGRFRVFGRVKVAQTGQTCKNGLIDADGKVISTEQ